MQITIHDTNELSELDLRVLAAVVGSQAPEAPVSRPKPEPKAEAKAPATKAAPKAEKTPEPEPEPEDTEPEDNEPEAEEDEVPTLQDAVKLATTLVSNGKAADVKKALTDLGAKRVSELKETDVAAFISALS